MPKHLRQVISSQWAFLTATVAFALTPFWAGYEFTLEGRDHLRMIGYYGEYFLRHFWFPTTLNTVEHIGMPYPVFYGPLLYPLLAPLSSLVGPLWTLMVLSAAIFFVQLWAVEKLAFELTTSRWRSRAIAVTIVLAIYPATNLYTRGAITEFVAVGLLQAALSLFLLLLVSRTEAAKKYLPLLLIFLVVLAFGSHPITLMMGSLMGVTLILTLRNEKALLHLKPWFKILALSGVTALGSWLYVTLRWGSHLLITQKTKAIMFFDFDTFLARISPFPFDPRTLGLTAEKLNQLPTPFLDAQINMPLFLLVMFLFFLSRKKLKSRDPSGLDQKIIVWGMGSFAVFFIFSLLPGLWRVLPPPFEMIQFAYRLVSFCNLSLFVAFIGLLIRSQNTKKILPKTFLIFSLLLTFAAYGLKIPRTFAGSPAYVGSQRWVTHPEDLVKFSDFYGHWGYAVTDIYEHTGEPTIGSPELPRSQILLPVTAQENFGETKTGFAALQVPSTLFTNIQAFPWNHLLVNGQEARTKEFNSILALELTPRNYLIDYALEPDPLWQWLRLLSLVSFFLLTTVTILNFFRDKRR